MAVSPDGWDCVTCGDGTSREPTTGKCVPCADERVLNSRDEFGGLVDPSSCQECADNFGPTEEGNECERCSADVLFVNDNVASPGCDCTTVADIGVCLPTNPIVTVNQPDYVIDYSATESQESIYLEQNLEARFYKCSEYIDIESCQALANLCAMSLYKTKENIEVPCSMLQILLDRPVLVANAALPPAVPEIRLSVEEIEDTENFPEDYTMDTGRDSDWLRLVAYKYDVDGNFMGFEEAWKTGAFQLCKGDQYSLQLAFRFGKDIRNKCSLRVRQLVDEYETVFYDVFLKFTTTNDATDKLFNFPIQFGEQTEYYRRLFLVDNLSGQGATGDNIVLGSYVSKIEIYYSTSFKSTNPISMKVTHSPLFQSDYDNDKTVETEFSVEYDQKYGDFNQNIGIAIGVIGVFVMVYSVVKINGWRKRAGATTLDLLALLKFMFSWFGATANAFFLVLFFTGLYMLISWRNQDVLYILLPAANDRGDIRPFIGYFWTGFLAKCIEVLHLIYSQCNVDIFFIDWERPKSTKSPSDTKKGSEASTVSIWRTYFVANEWNEIQTIRKTNVLFQIVAVIFFLEGLNFKEFARADPSNDLFPDENYVNSPYNTWLRFAVGASVYVAIGIAQYLVEILFYSRFIEDPFNQFVDLCSISNISCFIMSQKQYGYYIHGRSVHGFADANLAQLSLLMQKEQDDLRGTRGLLPDSSIQTFEMIVPLNLRTAYRKLYKPPMPSNAAKAATTATSGDQTGAGVDRNSLSQLNPQLRKCIEGYNQLNAFLAAFINRDIPDCDYEVRERPFLEKLLDMEFVENSPTRGIFYSDAGHVFDKVLFYGNEFSLFVFDVYLFVALDYMIGSYLLSAIGVYIVQKIMVPIREILGQRNLAKKTLVDERFLI
ncbi:meckelin-like isoform X2 [Symsagittifera roscoffensis]|uniref:meckelin-like isoform X2 n=1 Tax=Symsagittifera roscoffensis TaxID=84072 RepID=UPI00307CBEBF